MTTLFNICFFVAIIFIYLHIINETKKSTQMEIYETEYVSNDNLQKICELKQPFIFDSPATLEDAIHINSADGELKTKDTTDSVHYVNLNGSAFSKLINNDKKSKYFTEKNGDFIHENPHICDTYKEINSYLQPHLVSNTKYDYLCGSNGSFTPLRYHTYSRKFLYVGKGKIRVKMTSWHYEKYMKTIHDYEHLEHRSPINAWDDDNDVSKKVRFIDFDVHEHHVLFIPPYWLYSVKFSKSAEVYEFEHQTYMNRVVNSPSEGLHWMQKLTSKPRVLKQLKQDDENDDDSNTNTNTNTNDI